MKLDILDILPKVRENIPLAPYTTFKIGGPAKYFFAAKTIQDIIHAIAAARKLGIRFFVLAGGSNVLVSDKGFPGLVIYIQTTNYKLQAKRLYAEAGVKMATIVTKTGRQGLSGLEWAGGLPGTVGGAVRGNAGAFGGEIKDNLLFVQALDARGHIQKLNNKQCKFSYRNSFFKEKRWIVLSATFQLKNGNKKTIQAIAKDHKKYRKEHHPLEFPSAGSVFKNCDLKKFSPKLKKALHDVIKADPFPAVPTAYLIAQEKLQGMRVGNVQVSKKHPNYIVNLGKGKAKDVVQLVKKVKQIIKRKYGMSLEEEIQYVS